jgi:hypothetical protein
MKAKKDIMPNVYKGNTSVWLMSSLLIMVWCLRVQSQEAVTFTMSRNTALEAEREVVYDLRVDTLSYTLFSFLMRTEYTSQSEDEPIAVAVSPLIDGLSIASNSNQPGVIKVAVVTPMGFVGNKPIIRITCSSERINSMSIKAVQVNEGNVPSLIQNISQFLVSGRVYFIGNTNRPLGDLEVNLDNDGVRQLLATGADGLFSFTAPAGGRLMLTIPHAHAEKEANRGVDVADIVATRKHILARSPFETAYAMVASDANRDASVDVADIVAMRKVILARTDFFSTDESGNKDSVWRFLDSNFKRVAAAQAFDQLEQAGRIVLENFSSDTSGLDFVGIKLGDVNGDWTPAEETQPLSVRNSTQGTSDSHGWMEGFSLKFGQITNVSNYDMIQVPVQLSESLNLMGLQFDLKWDSNQYELLNIQTKALPSFNPNLHSKAAQGLARLAWDDPILQGAFVDGDSSLVVFTFKPLTERPAAWFGEISNAVIVPAGIYQTGSKDSVEVGLLSEDRVKVSFETLPGVGYLIETKQDLSQPSWEPLTTIMGTGEKADFTDQIKNKATGFYRVISVME